MRLESLKSDYKKRILINESDNNVKMTQLQGTYMEEVKELTESMQELQRKNEKEIRRLKHKNEEIIEDNCKLKVEVMDGKHYDEREIPKEIYNLKEEVKKLRKQNANLKTNISRENGREEKTEWVKNMLKEKEREIQELNQNMKNKAIIDKRKIESMSDELEKVVLDRDRLKDFTNKLQKEMEVKEHKIIRDNRLSDVDMDKLTNCQNMVNLSSHIQCHRCAGVYATASF